MQPIKAKDGRDLYPVILKDEKSQVSSLWDSLQNHGGIRIWENVDLSSRFVGEKVYLPADVTVAPHWAFRPTQIPVITDLKSFLFFRRVQIHGDMFSFTSRGYEAAQKLANKMQAEAVTPRDAPLGRFHTYFDVEVHTFETKLKRENPGGPKTPFASYQRYVVVEWSAIEDPEDLPFENGDEEDGDV